MKKLFYRTAALLFCLFVFGCNENDGLLLGEKTGELKFIAQGEVVEVFSSPDFLTTYYTILYHDQEFSVESKVNPLPENIDGSTDEWEPETVLLDFVFGEYNFGIYKLQSVSIHKRRQPMFEDIGEFFDNIGE